MHKTFVAASLAATMAAGAFAADSYTIDPRHTYPVFEVSHLGFSTQRGRFNKATGKVTLDTAAKQGAIELVIDTASLDMGAEDWNKHMRSEDFFNVEKFPTMVFKSEKFLFDGDKVVGAHGTFTMLGVTKPLTVSLTGFRCANHPISKKAMCGADATATVTRSEFGMTKYVPAVSDDIRISVPVEAYKN